MPGARLQSYRWQSVAAIPEAKFERTIEEIKDIPGADVTMSRIALLRARESKAPRTITASE